MLSQNHPSTGCPIEENIFDGVLYCGVCGRKMTRQSYVQDYVDGRRERKDVYACLNSTSTKMETCQNSNRISRTVLVDILTDWSDNL